MTREIAVSGSTRARLVALRLLSIALLGILCACDREGAPAPVPLIPRADLFGNPERIFSLVSPDGKWLSYLAPVNGVMNLWVAPLGRLDEAQPVTNDTSRGIQSYAWAYDGRHLVYVQDLAGSENAHVYAIDFMARTTKDLTPFADARASIALVSAKVRDEILISMVRRDPRLADLYRVHLSTGALTLVMENPGFLGLLTDDTFEPRLAAVPTADGGKRFQRRDINGVWRDWIEFGPEDSRASDWIATDTMGRSAFILDSRGRDTAALARIDMETGAATVLAEEAGVDIGDATISDAILDPTTNAPLAYAVRREHLAYKALDFRIQTDIDYLNGQNLGDWVFNQRSEDDRYWKITPISDISFSAALYDRQTKTITKLYDPRPHLVGAPLVRMHSETITSRDGLNLVSYLSLPSGSDTQRAGRPRTPLPLVLIVHGGPHLRESFGFNAMHQLLANRGYAVLGVNFRGSAGFGKSFWNAGDLEWGGKMSDDLLDAVAWAVEQGIADPERVAILGWSYGGFATLVGMTRDANTYACGVDLYGPADLEAFHRALPEDLRIANSAYVNRWIGDPETEAGRTFMRERSPLLHADRLKSPLLIAQGANDVRVRRTESDKMVAAAKAKGVPVTYLLFTDEGHDFVRTENWLSFWAITEQFLAKCLGGRAEPIGAALKGSSLQVVDGAEHIDGLVPALAAREATPG